MFLQAAILDYMYPDGTEPRLTTERMPPKAINAGEIDMFKAFDAKADDSWMHEPVDDIDVWDAVNDNFITEVCAAPEAIHRALLGPDVAPVEGFGAD